jgi:amino acid adenylation domain-containing protein
MSQIQQPALRPRKSFDEGARAEVAMPGRFQAPADASGCPLSAAQRRLWLLDRAGAGGARHVARAVRLIGNLEADALAQGLAEVASRHDALRATFAGWAGAEPARRIAPQANPELQRSDLTPLPPADREAECRRLVAEEVRQPFDLEQGPLVRARLLRLGAQDRVLVLTAHQLVADHRSLEIVLNELAAFYNARTRGEPSPDLGQAARYAEWAAHQEDWLRGEAGAGQLAYWKGRLDGAPPALELFADRTRTDKPAVRAARQSVLVPEPLAQALEELSRREGHDLFDVLLAALGALLFRYTNQEDLLVGSPVSGREGDGAAGLVGPLENLLPLRLDFAGNPTFRELLTRVGEIVRQARAHQAVPLVLLAEEPTSYSPSGSGKPVQLPALQVSFALQEEPTGGVEFTWLETSAFPLDEEAPDVGLSVSATRGTDGLRVELVYDADRFEAAAVGRLAGHFQTLLEGAAADPGRHLSSLPLLTDVEAHEIVVGWNNTRAEWPAGLTISRLFEEQAGRTPRAVALVFENRQMTYGELNRRANRLAHQLLGLGVGPEVLVGICVERSVEMVVGLLGVLKAGGAYVPLDPAYPQERLGFMVSDAGIAVLLTQQHLASLLPPSETRTVYLNASSPEPDGGPEADNPTGGAGPDDLAYVIYTSGSTGRPKGVQVHQRAVVNFLLSMAREPGLTYRDTLLAVTTLSFDIAGLELFLPLTVGARLVLVPREAASDAARLMEHLAASGATTMQATPATWRLLIDGGWSGTRGLKILCGGEAMPRELAGKLLARGSELWNMYGPTETTIWSTVHRVDERGGSVSIGRPIANTQVYVLDAARRPVPVGVVGELYIGGDGVARGYLRRPELTEEKFVPDPFGRTPGARLFRTGDLARWLPTGELECLGRVDHQVKVRGFRIELGEVESALLAHPAVAKGVVVAREDTPGQRRLVGYIVAGTGAAPVPGELRRFVKERLPEYMVPAVVVVLEALPLTPNGKIDRRALPAPGPEGPEPGRVVVAPRNPLELELVQIWEGALGVRPVGVTDNFFDLGVDSLTAAGLFAVLQKRFGANLPPGSLFRAPTVEQLASMLRRHEGAGSWTALVPVQPHGSRPSLFCVHGGAGTILIFHGLAKHLGRDQPLYALQAQGLYGRARLLTRIEDMAAHYLREIRSVQPHGPYHLAGFCSFGGAVALEMAHQLRDAGEEVALLAGMNAPVPGYGTVEEPPPGLAPTLAARAARLRERVMVPGLLAKTASILRTVRVALTWRVIRLIRYFREMLYRYYIVLKKPVPDRIRRRFFVTMHAWAEKRYRPRPFPGTLVMFRAEGLYRENDMGWGALGQELEIHEVPGCHRHHRRLMDEPHVQILAEKVKACLEKLARK